MAGGEGVFGLGYALGGEGYGRAAARPYRDQGVAIQ